MDITDSGFIATIMGLVEVLKRLGVKGKWSIVASLVIGVLLGLGYKASIQPLESWNDWFGGIFFGVLRGLIASGIYDFVTARFPKQQTLPDADEVDEAGGKAEIHPPTEVLPPEEPLPTLSDEVTPTMVGDQPEEPKG